LTHSKSALFADPGVGKTLCTLTYLQALKLAEIPAKTLVIAPLRVTRFVWKDEIKKWGFNFKFQILYGPDKESRLKKDADIYLVNVENFAWLFETDEYKKFDILIIDESSKFKNHKSKRFKLLKQLNLKTKSRLISNFDRVHLLTGTPAPNGLMNLWSQIYLLDQGQKLGKFITHYQRAFFYDKFAKIRSVKFQKWIARPTSKKRIEKRISKYVFRIDAKDHIKLPHVKFNIVWCELPEDIKPLYKKAEKAALIEIENKKVFFKSKAVAYNACRQIANGALYEPLEFFEFHTDKRKYFKLHNEKLDAIADIVDELQGKPVLIAFNFKHDLKRLLDHFGKDTPFIGGTHDRKYIRQWNQSKLPVLLSHSASISHGLNLQYGEGRDIIWFGLTDDLEAYEQLNKRINRQGVKGTVRIHIVLTKDTFDEIIMERNRLKNIDQQSLLNAFRKTNHV
jgi:SNF2 family DNA or RNA helicase